MKENVKVYVKVNEKNEVTDINSDVFIRHPTGWIKIDEGQGDRYAHAQNNYLPGPTLDDRGRPRYKLSNGVICRVK